MAVDFKTLLVLIFFCILHDVYLLPIDQDLKRTRTTDSAVLSYDKNSDAILVRTKKELVMLGTCSRGKQWYFGKCRTPKEYKRIMDNDDITTKVAKHKAVAVTQKHTTPEAVTVAQTEVVSEDKSLDKITTESIIIYDVVNMEEFQSTESEINNETRGGQAIPSITTFDDNTDVNGIDLDRMENLIYTLLMVGSCAVLLIWLSKVLYDFFLTKDDDAVRHSDTTVNVHEATCSRQQLCPS